MRDPAEMLQDHQDDFTPFEISIINKRNEAMLLDCLVKSGEIHFDKIMLEKEEGFDFA